MSHPIIPWWEELHACVEHADYDTRARMLRAWRVKWTHIAMAPVVWSPKEWKGNEPSASVLAEVLEVRRKVARATVANTVADLVHFTEAREIDDEGYEGYLRIDAVLAVISDQTPEKDQREKQEAWERANAAGEKP